MSATKGEDTNKIMIMMDEGEGWLDICTEGEDERRRLKARNGESKHDEENWTVGIYGQQRGARVVGCAAGQQ